MKLREGVGGATGVMMGVSGADLGVTFVGAKFVHGVHVSISVNITITITININTINILGHIAGLGDMFPDGGRFANYGEYLECDPDEEDDH